MFWGELMVIWKRVICDCSLQSDSEHPIFSPLSSNSRNTVYKLWFARFCWCAFSPPWGTTPGKTHKQNFATHPVRDNPVKVFLFMCFFLSLKDWALPRSFGNSLESGPMGFPNIASLLSHDLPDISARNSQINGVRCCLLHWWGIHWGQSASLIPMVHPGKQTSLQQDCLKNFHWRRNYYILYCEKSNPVSGRLIFCHYWCWRAGGAAPVKTSTGNNFPRNTREFPEIISSAGAKFWQRFCLSVPALVNFIKKT